jgi:hypothetical protein
MHIKDRKPTPRPPVIHHRLKSTSPQKHFISHPRILPHPVHRIHLIYSRNFPPPQPARIDAPKAVVGVERCEVQGTKVKEHEVPRSDVVEVVEGGEDAGDVVGQGDAGDLGVGEEGVDA